MTRPSNKSQNPGNLREQMLPEGSKIIALPEGMEIEIKLRPVETPSQRTHRQQMEVRQFWVKEAPVHLTAIVIVISVMGAALIVSFRRGSTVDDLKWAYSMLSSLLVGVVGFAFGKAAK